MNQHHAYGLDFPDLEVLIIEDNLPMQMIYRAMLNSFGVTRLRMLSDTTEAVDAMRDFRPNLLIVDWKLQGCYARDLIKEIRSVWCYPLSLVPIVVISGYTEQSVVQAAIRAGAHAFLSKPLSAKTLYERLKWVMLDDRDMIEHDSHYIINQNNSALPQIMASPNEVQG